MRSHVIAVRMPARVVLVLTLGLGFASAAHAASPGDMNCDGVVNGLDIPLFVACLVNGNCNTGMSDCDGNPANGCETNTNTNVNNCGACGHVCSLPNAVSVCVGGVCMIGACNTGFFDCNLNPADGCEVDTTSSPTNCGSCGFNCPTRPNSTPVCVMGTCGFICSPGYSDCDGVALNGCETHTTIDLNNCGNCNHVCSVTNGSSACTNGVCVVASCNPGFRDCDGNINTGCETNTNTSITNCGNCGVVCPVRPNSTPVCVNGICGFICSPGYRDCDGVALNGCETNTNIDANNCGNCNVACPSGHACVNAVCQ